MKKDLSFKMCELFEQGKTVEEIADILKVSAPTVAKYLKQNGYPKCRRCGVSLAGERLNMRYCETCRKIINIEMVRRCQKAHWDLKNINGVHERYSVNELSTHGDLYNLNGTLGTLGLAQHYDTFEDEWEAIQREHARIFGR